MAAPGLQMRNNLVTHCAVDAVAQALAAPIRRRILLLLGDRASTAGAVAQCFRVSRPAVSRHLRVLREAGLVADEASGRERTYRLRLEALCELEAFLRRLRAPSAWEQRFAALATEVHRVKARRRHADLQKPHRKGKQTA
jgi:DNA-binding transcriptional ArsR family regulator